MKANLKCDFSDNEPIMDSIYGVIRISMFEKTLLSTKEMQRLRGIKQLGFVNLVYPDAEHSRFSHSIGVCHQAKMLMNQISQNITSQRYINWRRKFISQTPLSEVDGLTEIERIVIASAALMHDLSHSPFSHEIESPTILGHGIPIHDDLQNNYIFFSYLFDKDKSEIAKVIDIYNQCFWELAKEDQKWGESFAKNKNINSNGYISISDMGRNKASSNNKEVEHNYPILGALIFEIMLFDKMCMWLMLDNQQNPLRSEDGFIKPNNEGIEICINDKHDRIKWKPIENWFRPYRKDIIANTICADLLDYLLRDGKNTGILPSLDLKFFDRMTLAKAIPEKTETLIPLSKIPDFCEHVVFDIYDHKRGIIRQSVITEIISFLQQRYLLTERVYEHRVVEAARTMLQESARLLIKNGQIKLDQLHDVNSEFGAPINDEALFSWILNIKDSTNKEIIKSKQLIRMLRHRRIFREIVIIDGVLGAHKGTYRGSDIDCRTLAEVLNNDTKRNNIINVLNSEFNSFFKAKGTKPMLNSENATIFTISVRRWGKRYKIPRVLVARPLNNEQEDDIETFPLFEGKKLPSISGRLDSMQHAYNSLWKVYLFMHPFFHYKDYSDLHDKLAKTFLTELQKETGIIWNNSIEKFNYLLPQQPVDISAFINKYENSNVSDIAINNWLSGIIRTVNSKIPIEKEEFLLGDNHKEALRSMLAKSHKEVFEDLLLQDRILKGLDQFTPPAKVAAKDNEEFILKSINNFIDKLIENDRGLFI